MTHSQTSPRRLLLFLAGSLIIAVVAAGALQVLKSNFKPGGSFYCAFNDCDPTTQLASTSDSGVIEEEITFLPLLFTQMTGNQLTGPLYVHPTNPRYFTDDGKRAILLTGTHTWANLQDSGATDPPIAFDYEAYLDFLEANNHNFFRLWHWEQTKWGPWLPSNENIFFNPHIYQRTGPGTAKDGKPKFDVSKFNQAYFDRLRQHVIEARDRGFFVSVMLFDGWSIDDKNLGAGNPWLGHPYNPDNNINGVDGDYNNDNNGHEVHTLQIPAVTTLQEAYVKKVIDTVNDLDNVLYEISNESHGDSQDWQYYMINFIHNYEASKPKQHPVGMTVEWPSGDNAELFASPADWIAPNSGGGYLDNPPAANGSKVIVNDTDHLWGIGGNRQWVWQSFTRGLNPIFMDPYNCSPVWPPDNCDSDDPEWVSLRRNMGYARSYADRMNLAAMTPRGDLCSTDYCLANPVAGGAEYLVYLPAGATAQNILETIGIEGKDLDIYLSPDSSVTVNLSGTPGQLSVEWFNPETGVATAGSPVNGGGNRNFTAPFGGDAVLYLYQEDGGQSPVLSISMSGPETAIAGELITYELTVSNSGNAEATNLTITDTLPDGATYVSGGTLQGDTVTWNVPSLAAQKSTKMQFTFTVTDNIVNSEYEVTSDEGAGAQGSKEVVTEIADSPQTHQGSQKTNCMPSSGP